MQLEQQESFTLQGPQLEVLGEVETKLPPPLKKRSTAGIFLAVMVALSVFGIGGAKLRGQYNKASAAYTAADAHNNSIPSDLGMGADAAANVITMSGNVLGTDAPDVQAAQAALDAWNATTTDHPADQYGAYTALVSKVDALYQVVSGEGSSKADAITTQYDEVLSRQDIVARAAAESYNPTAEEYNKKARSFPANVIGMLWGAGKVELYG